MPASETVQGAKVIRSPDRPATGAMLEAAEKKLGLRCSGCNRRIHNGFRVTEFRETFDPQEMKPVIRVAQGQVCVRDDCGAAGEAMAKAHLVEKIENVWMDEVRGDAPKTDEIIADVPAPDGDSSVPAGR